jgi:hypothetical protein
MRTASFVATAILLAASASAQPIHGHPQKQAYASAAEYAPLDGQCWANDPDPLKAAHVHTFVVPPSYMRFTDLSPYDVRFTIKLHNVPGSVGQVGGEHVQSIKWDATGSSEMPVMKGDPNGLVEWSGTATISHTIPSPDIDFLGIFQFPQHGWAEDKIVAYTNFDDGRRLDTGTQWAVYSAIDLSAPEKKAAEQGNPGVHVRTSCVMWSNDPAETAGEVITELSDYTPLAPIFAPWKMPIFPYNYTAPAGIDFPAETLEQRKDPDLHHGVTGVLQRREISPAGGPKSFQTTVTLDPAEFGAGKHKVMFAWTQPLLNGSALSAVMVIPVEVGEGIPPPTLCTDPTATNVGQPLPCKFPAPPVRVTVPNVVGKAQGIATADLLNLHLALGAVTLTSTSSLPAGDVVSQSPAAGASVAEGSAVSIVVSSPPPPIDVCPNLPNTQLTVPEGFEVVNGQCVPIAAPPSLAGTYTFTCDAAGSCKLTVIKP